MYQRTGCDREDKSGPGIASTDESEMAVTMASTDGAMRRWLRIVGAERSGRTAISHQHGKACGYSFSTAVSAFSCGGSKPVNRISRLASSTFYSTLLNDWRK